MMIELKTIGRHDEGTRPMIHMMVICSKTSKKELATMVAYIKK